MANAAGMLKESIWRDKEFRALPRTAQATYAQLISQKELDRAGIQPLQIAKWAKGCDETTPDDLTGDLKVLEAHRFVFVDYDTDELFIRSYMRHCDIARYPNILKNALRCAGMVASEKIRHELAAELRRLRKSDADRVADQIEPDDFENGSETKPNPSGTLQQTVPERLNGSETLSEPPGYGSGSGSVTLGSTPAGEPTDEPRTDNTEPKQSINEPPPETCPKHRDTPDPPPCGACAGYRRRRDCWFETRDERQAQQRAEFWAAVRACPDCDANGQTETDAGRVRRCTNHNWELIHA